MKLKKIFKAILMTSLIMLVIFLTFVAIYISNTLRDVKNLDLNLDSSTTNYSRLINLNGDITTINPCNSNNIKIKDLKPMTINAFISIEDKNFYTHKGINPKRMIKAGLVNLLNKEFTQGASTITQQLVKNKFLTLDKTLDRKIKEIYLSLKLEKEYSKERILEEYLNSIYYGSGAYGIENASIRYFNKSAKDLNLNESAILAAIINSPSRYSPIHNQDNLIIRRNLVLEQMLDLNYITNDEYNDAIAKDIEINLGSIESNQLDLYGEYALQEACEILNMNKLALTEIGYKIYTYQDKNIQNNLNDTINNDEFYQKNNYGNIADSLSIIIDNDSYGVSAIAGRSKYDLINFRRQPGSLIKPIVVFAPAYEEGVAYPISQILDSKIDYDGYSPNNVGNKFYGYVSVRDSVAKSLNIPTIKLAEKLGLEKCKNYGSQCGINFDKNDVGYSLVLGGLTEGATLKEITDSYSVFSNSGNYTKSNFIKEIKTKDNITIYSRFMTNTNVFSADTAYLMTDTLSYSVDNGTSKKLSNFNFDIAGKTGTVLYNKTNYNTDAYSLAYTSNHTMSVWLGNYSMDTKHNLLGSNNGGTFATAIISNVFDKIYKDNPPENFVKPETIVECKIDAKTLNEDHIVALANNTPERYQITELFSSKFLPHVTSNKFDKIAPFDFDISCMSNSISIAFDTNDYLEYYIYKIDNDNIHCVDTIYNKNDKYEFLDYNIKDNTLYSYYIVAKNKHNKNISYTTPIHKIYSKSIIQKINNNDSWIFA